VTFRLVDSTIDPAALLAGLDDKAAGACVTFEGRVRESNEGRVVVGLEYETYKALAEKEGLRIMDETAAKFPVLGAICVHRTGKLALGELAVWVAVTAAHRGGAFEASRFIIDQVKERVPIWKKEYYRDGTTDWINCAPRSAQGPSPELK
jgi:molybdopterin synthase catalytic subunit